MLLTKAKLSSSTFRPKISWPVQVVSPPLGLVTRHAYLFVVSRNNAISCQAVTPDGDTWVGTEKVIRSAPAETETPPVADGSPSRRSFTTASMICLDSARAGVAVC